MTVSLPEQGVIVGASLLVLAIVLWFSMGSADPTVPEITHLENDAVSETYTPVVSTRPSVARSREAGTSPVHHETRRGDDEDSIVPTWEGATPLAIEVVGPSETVADVPVSILWTYEPVEREAFTSDFVTDVAGVARVDLYLPDRGTDWFWADLGFPTLGGSATSIPKTGGRVRVANVPSARLDVLVREVAGPLTEPVKLEVRAVDAVSPGDRWHAFFADDGRFDVRVEAGIELELRVRSESSRAANRRLVSPRESGERAQVEFLLDGAGLQTLRVQTEGGAPIAGSSVELLRRDDWRRIGGESLRTDDEGRVTMRIPRSVRTAAFPEVRVVTDVAGLRHVGSFSLQSTVVFGGAETIDVVVHPASTRTLGHVFDETGSPVDGALVALEYRFTRVDPKRPDEVYEAWQPVARVRTDADGRFQMLVSPPERTRMQLRLLEPRRSEPIEVDASSVDVELVVPPAPRSGFRIRSRRD